VAQYAIVKDEVVTNVIEWDGVVELSRISGDNLILITDKNPGAGIGWACDGVNFVAPIHPPDEP
jgi:hypothetical protein